MDHQERIIFETTHRDNLIKNEGFSEREATDRATALIERLRGVGKKR